VQKSQILDKYLSALEKDPKSRVFAPLAEYYRKSGLLSQAIETLNQGIKHNPDYVLGHLGLAFCYYENGDAKRSYDILRPLIDTNRDNLRMLRLYSDACLELSKNEEALETLKYLLFVNPKDKEAAEKIKLIENDNKKFGPIKFNLEDLISPEEESQAEAEVIQFNVDELDTSLAKEKSIDEWTKLDLSNEKDSEDSLDTWSMNQKPILKEEASVSPVSEVEAEREFRVEKVKVEQPQSSSPVITHTLVDLYCNQGYLDKAKDLLEKILELNPGDLKTKLKLQEVDRVLNESFVDDEPQDFEEEGAVEVFAEPSKVDSPKESDGRDNLMNLFDQKFNNNTPEKIIEEPSNDSALEEFKKVEAKLWEFHKALEARAKTILSR